MSYGYRRTDFPTPWDRKAWVAAALFAVLVFALAHGLFSGWPLIRFAALAAAVALFIRAFFWSSVSQLRLRRRS
jgi:hypothetical protein